MEFLIAPSVIFLIVVAPMWISHHYRYKSKMSEGISSTELKELEEMLETIDKLSDRVETLEAILTEEHPGWEKSVRARQQS